MKKFLISIIMILTLVSSVAAASAGIEPYDGGLEPYGIEYLSYSYDIEWGQPAPKPRIKAYGKELIEHRDFEYCYEYDYPDDASSGIMSNYMSFMESGRFTTVLHLKDLDLAERLHNDYLLTEYDMSLFPLDSFEVRPAPMSKVSCSPLPQYTYGDYIYGLRDHIELSYNGIKLDTSDFSIIESNNNTLNETVTITMIPAFSAFSGSLVLPLNLLPHKITQENTVFEKYAEPYEYHPDGCCPGYANGLGITVDGETLYRADYDAVYENNKDLGTGTITITGKGNYTGSATTTFQIGPRDISDSILDYIFPVPYTGKPVRPEAYFLSFYGHELVEGKDFDIEVGQCIELGEYPVTFVGKNRYKGSLTATFQIKGIHISACENTVPRLEYNPDARIEDLDLTVTFKGKTLVRGTDYWIYFDNKGTGPAGKNPFKIYGTGDYSGDKEAYYEVYRDISKMKCVVKDAAYTGKGVTPSVVLTDGTDEIKVDSKNFNITYKNNTKIGTASVTVEGKGYYYGKTSGTFKVVKATPTPTSKPTAKPTSKPNATTTTAAKPTSKPASTTTTAPKPTTKPVVKPVVTQAADPKTGIMDFVKRIYKFVLDREPEEDGAKFWSDELWSFRRTGAEVGLQFIFSDEFVNRGLSDEDFITVLYKTFFGREPEKEGFDFWVSALSDGSMDRRSVANGFVYSQEWSDTCVRYGIRSGGIEPSVDLKPGDLCVSFVERMYTTAMNRESDPSGLEFWSGELANFRYTGEQVGVMFFLSEEMQGFNLSNEEFVTRLYKTFMDREPEEGGYNFWVGYLNDGGSREGAVLGFTRSEEFVNKCIEARILPY